MSATVTAVTAGSSALFGGGVVTAIGQLFAQQRDYRLRSRQAEEMGPVERESLQVKTTSEAVAILAKAADAANARADVANTRAESAETWAKQLDVQLNAMRENHAKLWAAHTALQEECTRLAEHIEHVEGITLREHISKNHGVIPPDLDTGNGLHGDSGGTGQEEA